ncbi:MAG: aspartate carbamoyltransferase catalytic subunit [Marinicellaceae bacterium]
MKQLITINDLSRTQIMDLLNSVTKLKQYKNSKPLENISIANLFFENSTRTLVSFELAAKKLGATVINVNLSKSSTQKNETVRDTLLTLQAMGINAFVIRHSENGILQKVKQWLNHDTVLINAGDGNNQHPTQALLDCYTILKHKPEIAPLKISIIGDIKHSRVANSLIDCLHILGNKNINIYGPKQLLPSPLEKAIVCNSLEQTLKHADVIVMLRIQKERMQQHTVDTLENYHENYGLNREKLKLANSDCIVMHPGPINREVEISSELADSFPSLILEQVHNGVLIRQALLLKLCS